jgi:hypothetical protein
MSRDTGSLRSVCRSMRMKALPMSSPEKREGRVSARSMRSSFDSGW